MYIAHKYNDRLQSVDEHCKNVAKISYSLNGIKCLNEIVKLIGAVHDVGKYSEKFQKYIEEGDCLKRGSVKHAIASGLIFDDLNIEDKYYPLVRELINNVVMCHHGIDDFVSPNDFHVRQEDRIMDFRKNYDCDNICKCFFDKQMSKSELEEKVINICKDIEKLFLNVKEKFSNISKLECDFYINMIARYLMSVLIDADGTDAANFENGIDFVSKDSKKETWNKFSQKLNKKLNMFENKTEIDNLRSEISNKCFEASQDKKPNIYRLAVPTGMGKTLSSLRFAIEKCRRKNKDHIFYIAPFNSILEQNAKDLKDVAGDENVLEHHCNVISDESDKTANETYECKIKNWDSPVIATSAVRFLNCLFGGRREDIQRFHTLSNSVIIIDEIQFLPIKCTYIFNLAINFLSKICDADVVLCSATQPPFDELSYKIQDIKSIDVHLDKLPTRVSSHLVNDIFKNEDEFTNFIKDKIDLNCLIIVNTKKCALKIYKKLNREFSDYKVYYLSTNMCAQHRNDVLENHIRQSLKGGEKIICVSTQLIEAGVDISFQTVVRSMCGMDSIIQSCGRCNRNNEYAPKKGKLYVVKFFEEFENLGSLEDIKFGKRKSQNIFHLFKKKIEENNEYIFSKEIMDKYYNEYFGSRRGEMTYPINNSKFNSSILELLSVNTNDCHNEFVRQNKIEPFMMQAPKTAGREFEVITDGEKEDFIVYYKDSGKLIAELYADKNFFEKMKIIKKLQRYTVSLYENEYKNLDYDPRYLNENYSVNILSERNYNEIFGVSSEESDSETWII
ncbi:MAG: CRISPR-associated helicase Cas3' [Clostridia bacterium]|nr:CRISPR-associated helicase Cas3' [Clostridia bacterium]